MAKDNPSAIIIAIIVIAVIILLGILLMPSSKETMAVSPMPLVDRMARMGRTYDAVYLDGSGALKTPKQPLYATLDNVSVAPPKYSLAVHFKLPSGAKDMLNTGLSTIRYTGTFVEGDSTYSILAPDYPKYLGSEEYLYRLVSGGIMFQHIVNNVVETQIILSKRQSKQ